MKRRTNLFYVGNNIDESNFLTFSNYPEHLTGITLTSDFKVYPSRFLCLYIPSLTKDDDGNDLNSEEKEKRKTSFIKDYLVSYYENKLAFLRDKIQEDNNIERDPDKNLRYLGYLIDTIYKFDNNFKIVYDSTIIEYNYKETFSDIICTIDSSKDYYTYNIGEFLPKSNLIPYEKNDGKELPNNKLYGWELQVPSIYSENVNLEFDTDEQEYSLDSSIDYIIRTESVVDEIKFNILIPLYDSINIDNNTNNTEIDENFGKKLELNYSSTFAQNVPYGIWFVNEDIILKRANFKNYAPSWSLTIGVQFKPFPNSNFLVADNFSDDKYPEYFSTIMCAQTQLFNKLEEYKKDYNDQIRDKLGEIESCKLSIEELKSEIKNLKERIDILEGTNKKNNTHTWVVK